MKAVLWLMAGLFFFGKTALAQQAATDSVAEKMLLYQRRNGGWPQPHGNPIQYQKPLSPSLHQQLLSEKNKQDTEFDDDATTREIRHLAAAYARTRNPAYRQAAEAGIRFLLQAQLPVGGWPQFYPDSGRYHGQITYNDGTMMHVVDILTAVAERTPPFDALDAPLVALARKAVERALDCILKTQYVQNGTLTVWGAQHDRHTLLPVAARNFEPASLSGSESVGIVRWLMQRPRPSAAVRQAVEAAVAWFNANALHGIALKRISDPAQPSGKDVVVVSDSAAPRLWARFYDLHTNEPIFMGRDQVPHKTLAEVENERRVGYGYYGTWPEKLLTKDYPAWKKRLK